MTTTDWVIKGFNAGYIIQKYDPQLSNVLKKGLKHNKNPYAIGFLLGGIQCLKERDLDLKQSPDMNQELDGLDLELDLE